MAAIVFLLLAMCCIVIVVGGLGYYLYTNEEDCPEGQEWDKSTGKCKSKCANGEEWDKSTGKCKSKCVDGEEWDATSSACKSKCMENQVWDATANTCKTKYYKCQFIKVTKGSDIAAAHDNHLSMRELEAYDESGTNVALNKPATSSSNWSNDTPGLVVNGNGRQTYHTGNATTSEWWQVDLGSEMNIKGIKVWRQTSEPWSHRFNGAKIQLIAADGKTVVHEVIAETLDKTKQNPYEQEFKFDETSTTETFHNLEYDDKYFEDCALY